MIVTEDSYDKILYNLIEKKKSFVIIERRKTKEIYFNNTSSFICKKKDSAKFDTSNLSDGQVKSFFTLVARKIRKYIIEKNFEIEKIDELRLGLPNINKKQFDNLKVGDYFWVIDLNNAYWQMMYRLDIINKECYKKYSVLSDYRVLKQVAIGLTTSVKKTKIVKDGQIVKDVFGNDLIIEECLTQWKQVYDNVRVSCYNVPLQLISVIGSDNYIFYNQDAVAFKVDCLDMVDCFYRDNEFEYKKFLCQKISDIEYTYSGQIRKLFDL